MNNRLAKLAAADPGFFVLGVHAKVESLICRTLPVRPDGPQRYSDYVHLWFDFRKDQVLFEPRSHLRSRLIEGHKRSNVVRHEYGEVLPEEAEAAAQTLLEFLVWSGFDKDEETQEVRRLADDWAVNRFTVAESPKLKQLQAEVELLRRRAASQVAEYAHLKERESLAAQWNFELQALAERLKAKDLALDQKRSEADGYRRQVKELEAKLAENRSQLGRLADLRGYLNGVARLTALTRSRRAFEAQVLRLTPEQQALADRLPVDRETLIRGGAGTGKSLVLLKLLQRIVGPTEGGLGLDETRPSVVLLTYTKALTKYGAYLGGLLGVKVDDTLVRTADSMLYDLASKVLHRKLVYQWVTHPAVAALLEKQPLGEAELTAEAELLVWGWDLSLDEYLVFERSGFKKRLVAEDRRKVWQVLSDAEKVLEGLGLLPAVLAARNLVRRAEEWDGRRFDYVLLDEAQDLPPVTLRFFRALARRGLVLAADEGQNLNQSRSPFVRAGLDLAGGRTRVLKTNFRNTRALEQAALPFYDGPPVPGALRSGPAPEFVFADHAADLLDALVHRLVLLTDEFGYAPENLLLVHAGSKSGLEDRLRREGRAFRSVADTDFDFAGEGGLRLATFQSAKGLDAPVVLVLWNHVFASPGWSPEAVDRLHRNFVYVALTRALDQAYVFARNDGSPVVELMRKVGGEE